MVHPRLAQVEFSSKGFLYLEIYYEHNLHWKLYGWNKDVDVVVVSILGCGLLAICSKCFMGIFWIPLLQIEGSLQRLVVIIL